MFNTQKRIIPENKLVGIGIVSALLNWQYNIHNVYDCLLSGRRQTILAWMCSSGVTIWHCMC